MTFDKLNIIEPVLKALKEKEYSVPTPIQQEAIPVALEKQDLLGLAQTGTGKTAAFAIPIIQHLYNEARQEKKKIRRLKLLYLLLPGNWLYRLKKVFGIMPNIPHYAIV